MGSHRKRILLVDEGTPVLLRYLQWLSPLAELHLAADGDDALWRSRATPIDVILWCFGPDHALRAEEVIRWLERWPHLPPVVLVVPSRPTFAPVRPFVVGMPAPPGPLWAAIKRTADASDDTTGRDWP